MTRRHLQLAIGILWLLDGIFQLQPKMFTAAFANNVILPAASGQPTFVSLPIHWFVSLFLLNPTLFNSLVVVAQLSIGVLILNKKTVKIGLITSVFWGLLVWIIGEGYGGIFSGQFSLLMGAPGAAIIYSLLAVAAYPSIKVDRVYWLALVWSFVWIVGAVFFVFNQHSISSVATITRQGVVGAPNWLAAIDNHVASFIGGQGGRSDGNMPGMSMLGAKESTYWIIILFGLAELFIGIGIFLRGTIRKMAIITGSLLLFVFWVIGQGLGGFYSGLMTDLNTAPLLILLGVYLFSSDIDNDLATISDKIKAVII